MVSLTVCVYRNETDYQSSPHRIMKTHETNIIDGFGLVSLSTNSIHMTTTVLIPYRIHDSFYLQ